jgi:hypothetical protein
MECENLDNIRNLLALFNRDLIRQGLPGVSLKQFINISSFFNKNFNPKLKNHVIIGLTKDRTMQIFHKYGNLGITLCPKCFNEVEELIEDINKMELCQDIINEEGMMIDRNQLFKSLNRLNDIIAIKDTGSLQAIMEALNRFQMEDYKNIVNFVDNVFGIDRNSKEWKA